MAVRVPWFTLFIDCRCSASSLIAWGGEPISAEADPSQQTERPRGDSKIRHAGSGGTPLKRFLFAARTDHVTRRIYSIHVGTSQFAGYAVTALHHRYSGLGVLSCG